MAQFGPGAETTPYVVAIEVPDATPLVIPLGGIVVEGQAPSLLMGPGAGGVLQIVGATSIGGTLTVGGGLVQLLGQTTVGIDDAPGTLRIENGKLIAPALRIGGPEGDGTVLAGTGASMFLLSTVATLTDPNVLIGSGGTGFLQLIPSEFGAGGGVWVIGADGGTGDVASGNSALVVGVIRLGGDGAGPRGPGYGAWSLTDASVHGGTFGVGLELIVGSEGFGTLDATGVSSVVASPLVVGDEGGTGIVSAVGSLTIGGTTVLGRAGGHGTLVATGDDTTVVASGLWTVGKGGAGTIIAEDGALVVTALPGHTYASDGSATIVACGGGAINGGSAVVGNAMAADLRIRVGEDQGPTSVAQWEKLARVAGASGRSEIDLLVGGSGEVDIGIFGPGKVAGGRVAVLSGGVLTIDQIGTTFDPGAVWDLELSTGATFQCETFVSSEGSRLTLHRAAGLTPSVALGDADVGGEIRLVDDGASIPPVGATIPLVVASQSFVDRIESFDLPLWHGYPPLALSTPAGILLKTIDHVDALSVDSRPEYWVGMAGSAVVWATVDGVAYDITRQAVWSFDPPIAAVLSPGRIVGQAAGRTIATISFGEASISMTLTIRDDWASIPFELVSSPGDSSISTTATSIVVSGSGSRLSGDGRFALFESTFGPFAGLSGLIPPSTFVKDSVTGTLEVANAVPSGPPSGAGDQVILGPGWNGSISRDGRFVVFASTAPYVPSSGSQYAQVFLLDRDTGGFERISTALDGTAGNGHSKYPEVSYDGRYVAFESAATGLVEDDGSTLLDVFRWDRLTQTMMRASTTTLGAALPQGSTLECMTPDGRYIFFRSVLSGLLVGYRKDCETGELLLVTPGFEQTVPYASVEHLDASADGRYVAFIASGPGRFTPLEQPWDTAEMYLRDVEAATTVALSLDGRGQWYDANVHDLAIDDAGRFIAFVTQATNVLAAPPAGALLRSAYRLDRWSGQVELLSTSVMGPFDALTESAVDISGDGSTVLLQTRAANVLPFDGTNTSDVYLRRCDSPPTPDLDGDGSVGPGDLSVLLGAWGTTARGSEPADLDRDGVVGPSDVAILLAAWSG